MALYQKKWWKKLFKEKKGKKVDSLNDLAAMSEFLEEIDVSQLLPELEKLTELEKERRIAKPAIIQANLKTQADILNKILQRYESLQTDVDINGLRLKMVVNEFLKHAQKAGLHDLVKEKRQDPKWQGKW